MEAALKLGIRFNEQLLREELEIAREYCEWLPILEDGIADAWRGVALRSHDGKVETLSYDGDLYVRTPLLRRLPYIDDVINSIDCRKKRVRLLSLLPGAKIPEHQDIADHEETDEVRLHVPITTNLKATFNVNGSRIRMLPGELWYVDTSARHSVSNEGDTERVHLVIDGVRNPWLDDKIQNGASPFGSEIG